MRTSGLGLMPMLGLVFLLGCGNKQLIQCQDNLRQSQAQLEKAQSNNIEEKNVSQQMLSSLMTTQLEDVKKLKKQIEQARIDEKAKHQTALKNAYDKQKRLTQAVLELQGTIKRLKTRQNELAMKLAKADQQTKDEKKKITNTGEMLQVLAAENKRLKSIIEQLQKKREQKEAVDSGTVEE